MNFTDKQFETLAQYEPYLRTATRESWSRNPGRAALENLAAIWREYANYPAFRMSFNCSTCILNLLRDLGRPYFADKAEREEAAKKAEEATKKAAETTQEKKVGTTATKAPKVAGKAVKTKNAKK